MTPHEIEVAFSQAIADAGLGDTLIPADGKLHRFKVPADKGRHLSPLLGVKQTSKGHCRGFAV